MTEQAHNFRQSAVLSGLLTTQQLAQAYATAQSLVPGPARPVSDEQLAAATIQLGLLNAWQVEQLRLGRTRFNLGPYVILDSIGKGGMGQIFKGRHRIMGRVVAVKVLPRSRSTPEAIASFNHEIQAQARLDHPNLVRAYDAGHDGNVYFMVTELVPGTDLRKLVRLRGKLNEAEAATIISQAAAGLEHAHQHGLIHRDVKPGNLLVTPSGQTKVSDLGLVTFLDSDTVVPNAGRIVGTADYLSPEHIRTPKELTPASDVYSLGCTMYYAVTGKVPFPGGNTADKAKRHCEDLPLKPRLFNASLSDDFLAVLEAMMEKDPQRRIQSAAEVVQRLAPWATESVSGLNPASVLELGRDPSGSGISGGLSGVSRVDRWKPGSSPSGSPSVSEPINPWNCFVADQAISVRYPKLLALAALGPILVAMLLVLIGLAKTI